jgi:hypothetical protein
MATADRRSTRPSHLNLLTVGVVLAVAAVTFLIVRPDSRSRTEPSTPDTMKVESSSRHEFGDLTAMLAASDVVLSGRVIAAESGRVFGGVDTDGGAGNNAIRSRVLTLEVGEVIASRDPAIHPTAGTVVLVEEEGTLLDGTALVVDGVRRTRVGDAGIWFLAASRDPEFPGFTVVNSQGRYLLADPADESEGALRGGDRSDALVRRLEALGLDGLAAAVATAATP